MVEKLCDVGSERAVISGICQYGEDLFIDVSVIVNVNSFSNTRNQLLFNSLEKAFSSGVKNIDKPTLISHINSLGFKEQLLDKQGVEYINTLFNTKIHKENVIKQAAKIATLSIARTAQEKHIQAYNELKEITGDESIDQILCISEKPIFDMSLELTGSTQKGPELLSENIDEYLQTLCDNPIDNIGIPTPFPIYNKIIGGGVRTGVALVASRPKCAILDSKILTPTGWTTYREIKAGDVVCNPNGGVSKVLEVFETGVKDVYEFEFSDGAKTIACDEHRWKVKKPRWKEFKTLSLNDMKKLNDKNLLYDFDGGKKRYKWQFPLTKPVTFNEQKHLIHPYLIGIILTEGNLIDNEIIRLKQNHNSLNNYIPDEYIYDSLENRIDLMQGLFDGDGSCYENGCIKYSTSSKRMSESVVELVRSLGGICKVTQRKTKCNISYRIHIKFNDGTNYFSLPRKKSKTKIRTKPDLKRGLKNVKYLGPMETRCIKVDNDEELYITDDYIVTKNTGKTTLAKEIGLHVANLGIPVLFLDSEMNKNDQLNRSIASLSDLPINTIETGSFSKNVSSKIKVQKAVDFIKKLPYKHQRIAGKEFDEVLSIIRRWIHKDVGFDDSGKANPHLVLYDYFKLMNSSQISNSLQEYQVLGFQISKLSDFCGEYDTPVLAFVQINRDGINKETSDVISGSDRLLWLCTSMSIFKRKTAEEIAEDGRENGNMKLIPVECRFGEPLEEGDYINLQMDKEKSKVKELKTQRSVIKENKDNESGFSAEAEEVLF